MSTSQSPHEIEKKYISLLKTLEYARYGYSEKIQKNNEKVPSLCQSTFNEEMPSHPPDWYDWDKCGKALAALIVMLLVSVLVWILPLYDDSWDVALIILKIAIAAPLGVFAKYLWDNYEAYSDELKSEEAKEVKKKWVDWWIKRNEENSRIRKEKAERDRLNEEISLYSQALQSIDEQLGLLYAIELIPQLPADKHQEKRRYITVLDHLHKRSVLLSLSDLKEYVIEPQKALARFDELGLEAAVQRGIPKAVEHIEKNGDLFWQHCNEVRELISQYAESLQAKGKVDMNVTNNFNAPVDRAISAETYNEYARADDDPKILLKVLEILDTAIRENSRVTSRNISDYESKKRDLRLNPGQKAEKWIPILEPFAKIVGTTISAIISNLK